MSKKLSPAKFAVLAAISLAVANAAATDTAKPYQCVPMVKKNLVKDHKNDCQIPGMNSCAGQNKDNEAGAWILVPNQGVCDLIKAEKWSDPAITPALCDRLVDCKK